MRAAGRAALRSPDRRDRPRVDAAGTSPPRADRRQRHARRAHRRDPRPVRRVPRDRRRALSRSRDRGLRSHARRCSTIADARIYSATPAPVDRRRVHAAAVRAAAERAARHLRARRDAARRRGARARCSRSGSRGSTSSCSTAGTIAIATSTCTTRSSASRARSIALPHGGLQMAERTLTGETRPHRRRRQLPVRRRADRDDDCVPEIDDAHLPAALADSVTFHVSHP